MSWAGQESVPEVMFCLLATSLRQESKCTQGGLSHLYQEAQDSRVEWAEAQAGREQERIWRAEDSQAAATRVRELGAEGHRNVGAAGSLGSCKSTFKQPCTVIGWWA